MSEVQPLVEVTGGCAIQIVRTDKSGNKFELDELALERLLMKEEIRDKEVAVISVAGAFRKGKSFLLNFFLRYLDARYKKKDITDWIGPDDAPLEGFCWQGGSDRVTAGILMWSEIYTTELSNGTEVAIILLDTQGSFDSNSTVCDCATIFALSTLVSSVQVYNISQNLQEDGLQHLQLFTEYGRLALADSGRIPFQKLLFLVRDWSFPYEADYGLEGGQKVLEKRLEIKPNQHVELQYLRRHIRSCFAEINCYLMPHPGLVVATNPHFDGELRDIEPQFTKSIENLAPYLLAPENLIIKTFNEQKVKAKELYLYFKTYTQIFSGSELPKPKSMLVATAEANNLTALAAAKEIYVRTMDDYCGGSTPYVKESLLEEKHKRQKSAALEDFQSKRKMGGEELSKRYQLELSSDLDKMFLHYKLNNEGKNIFKAARTPAVFMTFALSAYILSYIASFIGLNYISSLSNLITVLSIVTLLTWLYSRFSGDNLEISNYIDVVADKLFEKVLKPLFLAATQSNIQTFQGAPMNLGLLDSKIEVSESKLKIH